MSLTHRLQRIEESLQRELAELIQHELEDPRVKNVTLSSVKVSPDLSHAKIYFVTLDESKADNTAKGLNKAGHYLRRQLAKKLELRIIPELHFFYDTTLRQAQHVVELINKT